MALNIPFVRVLALLLLAVMALLCASPSQAACVTSGARFYCDSREEAEAKVISVCKPASFAVADGVFESTANPVTFNGAEYSGYVYPRQRNKTTGSFSNCSTSPDPNAGWWRTAPLVDCEARNDDPAQKPGSGLYLDSQVAAKCVGGCTLDIVGDPIEVVQGRVQGQPANFYRFNREYTGEQCSGDSPPDDSEFKPVSDEDNDAPECNMNAGVCVTPDGDTQYCSFNPDGTPSTCVPAVDYDNDGIHDDDDAEPGTPQDGDDDGEGDESDNSASGGATCQTAPSCTGDGIACLTLYQQWKTRCAVEALRRTGSGPGEEDSDGFDPESERSAIDGHEVQDEGLEQLDPASVWAPQGDGEGGLSANLFGSGGGCPTLPSFTVGDSTFSAPPEFCSAIAFIRLLFLAIAGVWALRIVAE